MCYTASMPYKDKDKQREAFNRAARERWRNKRGANYELRMNRRKLVEDAKSVPCADCAKTFPFYVMDFDHKNPDEKSANVSSLVSRGASLARIQEEIDKCVVVCANCHRIRTWETKCDESRQMIA
jgi:hypothetical protein